MTKLLDRLKATIEECNLSEVSMIVGCVFALLGNWTAGIFFTLFGIWWEISK